MTETDKKHLLSLFLDDEVLKTAEEIQKHMHQFVTHLVEKTSCSYQDATNVYLVGKIAQLEISIKD